MCCNQCKDAPAHPFTTMGRNNGLVQEKDLAFVRFKGIEKRYGRVVAVKKMDLEIPEGALVTLLGPSGCGKTTLLRMLAGLETPTGGDIYIRGKRINDTPIHTPGDYPEGL